jgi:hypothetical protein
MGKTKLTFYNGIEEVSNLLSNELKELTDDVVSRIDKDLSDKMEISREVYSEHEIQSKIESAKIIINT